MKKSKIIICFALCFLMLFSAATLFACGSKDKYMVIFVENLNGASIDTLTDFPEPQNINSGKKAVKPKTNPSRKADNDYSYYTFLGWYTTADGNEEFDFNAPITKRTLVYAHWELVIIYYNLTFDYNHSGSAAKTVKIIKGEKAEPESADYQGYRLLGWSAERNDIITSTMQLINIQLFDFAENPITADRTLYAVWEKEWKLTYHYNYEGGQNETVTYGATEEVIDPGVPVHPDSGYYDFQGWYKNELLTEIYTFGGCLTTDISLYAKWARSAYRLTYDYNYDGSPAPNIVKVGANNSPSAPAQPVRAGYAFDGWTRDAAGTIPYNFAPISADTVVYAKWVKTFTVAFNLNYPGAEQPATQTVRSGSTAAQPLVNPSRNGYAFDGWYKASDGAIEYDFDAPVTADITIYAKWTQTFTVSFSLNYNELVYRTQSVRSGGLAIRPSPDPVRDGYAFDGWFTTSGGATQFNFNTQITAERTVYAKWTQLFTVTFDLNYTGAPEGPVPQTVRSGDTATHPSLPDPTREDYVFDGWYADSAGTTQFNFNTPITADTTIFAKWAQFFTVTFDLNYTGAPAGPAAQSVPPGNTATRPLTNPSRDGYAFDGWYTASDGAAEYDFAAQVTADITVYAKWTQLFTVTFSLNYDGLVHSTQAIRSGSTAARPSSDPVRDGYAFDGWYTTSGGATQFNFSTQITAERTVYARWTQLFTVTFDLNYTGAPAGPAPQTVRSGGSAVRPQNPTRTGDWAFTIWSADSDGEEGEYGFGAVTANITLYAQWKDTSEITETRTVTFNYNYMGATEPYDIQTVLVGVSAVIPTVPTRPGYQFYRWTTDAAGTAPYNFTPVTVDTAVYAQWTQLFTVTFDLNYTGAPGEPAPQTVRSGDVAVRPSPDPARQGYAFDGWYTDSNGTAQYVFSMPVTADTTIFAKWTQLFTVTFDLNYTGAPAGPAPQYVLSGGAATQPLQEPVRNGYEFDGWYTADDCITEYDFAAQVTADITVYAKWTQLFTVTFSLNYDGLAHSTQAIRSGSTAIRPSPDPVRDGYAFDGWYTTSGGAAQFSFSTQITANTTIYAKWTQLFTVTFDLNYVGAPAGPAPQSVRSGGFATRPSPDPVRGGYVFDGWYTSKDCVTEYNFGVIMTGNITVYAKWIEAFVVTFSLNYDGLVYETQIVLPNGTAERPSHDPEREGYRFYGWVSTSSGSNLYNFNTPISQNITVYARWIAVVTITFDLGYDGADEPLLITKDYGERIERPREDPSRGRLWAFIGWYEADSDDPFDFNTNVIENTCLYARWLRAEYIVTWDFNYTGAGDPATTYVRAGSVAREPGRPSRPSYTITGWYYDKALTMPFSFGTAISDDIVLYAKWELGYTFRIDYNYPGAMPGAWVKLQPGDTIPGKPVDPSRSPDSYGNAYTFVGWSTLPNGEPNFNGFGGLITGDITLYAQWSHKYVFEVEYTYVDELAGAGWSGGALGKDMIAKEKDYWLDENGDPSGEGGEGKTPVDVGASGGFYISYLYVTDLTLTFEIWSDREIDAVLTLRLSCESVEPIKTFTYDEYRLRVNGQALQYGEYFEVYEYEGGPLRTGTGIVFRDCYHPMDSYKKPFTDMVTVQIHLVAGKNVIELTSNNEESPGGTMEAKAPLVDCIKIETIADLWWNPITDNIKDK